MYLLHMNQHNQTIIASKKKHNLAAAAAVSEQLSLIRTIYGTKASTVSFTKKQFSCRCVLHSSCSVKGIAQQ